MHNWRIKPADSQMQQLQSTTGCYQEGTHGWDSPLLAPGVQGSATGAGAPCPLRSPGVALTQPAVNIHFEGT